MIGTSSVYQSIGGSSAVDGSTTTSSQSRHEIEIGITIDQPKPSKPSKPKPHHEEEENEERHEQQKQQRRQQQQKKKEDKDKDEDEDEDDPSKIIGHNQLNIDSSNKKLKEEIREVENEKDQEEEIIATEQPIVHNTVKVENEEVVRSHATTDDDNNIDIDIYYDIVIAGAGPSGLTAALFASRAGLNVYVLGSSTTGLLSQTKHLDNFPSFGGSSVVGSNDSGSDASSGSGSGSGTGPGWLEATYKQAIFWGTKFGPSGLLVSSIERRKRQNDAAAEEYHDKEKEGGFYFALKTNGQDNAVIRSYSVIVASGANPRKLELEGEDKLWGVSLHNCAICDGHIYQSGIVGFDDETPSKTTVLVVGGGDAALDAALLLSRYATKVILVHRRNEFTKVHNINSLNLVHASSKIEIMTPYIVKEWITDQDDSSQLIGVKLLYYGDNDYKEKEELVDIKIDGAFVMIGAVPNTDWINTNTESNNLGLELDDEGLIKTASSSQLSSSKMGTGMGMGGITSTNIPGIFAAGEVTDNIYKQAITAASAGAQAAIDAERWLRENRPSQLHQSQSQSQPKQQQQQQQQQPKQQQRITKTKTNTDAGADSDIDTAAASVVVENENKNDINESNDGVDINCDLTLQDCINAIIHKFPVVVFSKPWCPYCRKALEALSLAGISTTTTTTTTTTQQEESEQSESEVHHNDDVIYVIDLSQHSNTQEIQKSLQVMTGRRTVPNVFIGGISIGGGDETSKFEQNGQLVPLLEKAGAFNKKNNNSGNNGNNDTSSSNKKPSEIMIVNDGIKKKAEEMKTNNASNGWKTVDKVAPHANDGGDGGGGESCDLVSEECFLQIIHKYKVLMFSLSWCPECKRILELLNRIGLDEHDTSNEQIHIIDLDDYSKPISATIRQHMKKLTGRRSVPNLFINNEFIGGYYQTNEIHEQGQLIPKLQKVGVLL
jgi:thioredoxin reductase (NADPH)